MSAYLVLNSISSYLILYYLSVSISFKGWDSFKEFEGSARTN
jgi:hypothetical protein